MKKTSLALSFYHQYHCTVYSNAFFYISSSSCFEPLLVSLHTSHVARRFSVVSQHNHQRNVLCFQDNLTDVNSASVFKITKIFFWIHGSKVLMYEIMKIYIFFPGLLNRYLGCKITEVYYLAFCEFGTMLFHPLCLVHVGGIISGAYISSWPGLSLSDRLLR